MLLARQFFRNLIVSTAVLIVAFISESVFAQTPDGLELPPHFLNYFEGAATAGECSGALIRFTEDMQAPAIVMTNGHCIKGEIPLHGFVSDVQTPRQYANYFSIANANDDQVHALSTRLIYATLTKTDLALYELDTTYGALASQGIRAFELSRQGAKPGTPIDMISEKFKQLQFCSVGAVVPEYISGPLDTFNAYRYYRCESVHGWSGAPLVIHDSRLLVGVNNSHYENGQPCAEESPCEIDKKGKISVGEVGTSYGQQTALIWSCVTAAGEFNLNHPGCQLKWRKIRASKAPLRVSIDPKSSKF